MLPHWVRQEQMRSQSPMIAEGGAVMGTILPQRKRRSLVNIAHISKEGTAYFQN